MNKTNSEENLRVIDENTKSDVQKSISSHIPKSRIPTNVSKKMRTAALRKEMAVDENASQRENSIRRSSSTSRTTANANANLHKLRTPTNTAVTASQKRVLENQFTKVKNRYESVKKDLILKQQNLEDLHEQMSELHEKMITSGVKDPGNIEGLELIRIFGSKRNETKTVVANNDPIQLPKSTINEEFVLSIENKLKAIPNPFLKLCHKALKVPSKLVVCLAEIDEETTMISSVIKELEACKSDQEQLSAELENAQATQEIVISGIAGEIKKFWNEYEPSRVAKTDYTENYVNTLREKVESTTNELNDVQEKNKSLSEKKSTLESQLQKSKNKLRNLESQMAGFEKTIQQLQQKEANMEQRCKEFQKNAKNYEKMKDNLESRINELKEVIDTKDKEVEEFKCESSRKLETLITELQEEHNTRQKVENELVELQNKHKQLEEKSQRLYEMTTKTENVSTDGEYTNKDVILYKELKAARNIINDQEAKIKNYEEEKDSLMQLLREKKGEENTTLNTQLMKKIEEYKVINTNYNELKTKYEETLTNNKALEKKLLNTEKQLLIQCKDAGKAILNYKAVELEQQLSDLQNTVIELQRNNKLLEDSLTLKQLEIERKDVMLRDQYKKTRDDVIHLLNENNCLPNEDEKTTQNNGRKKQNLEQPEENSTAEIRQLILIMHNKQKQILHLEKLVKQMEDQQNKAQATRTRLESRIAQLELEKAQLNQKEYRYVKQRSSSSLRLSCDNHYSSFQYRHRSSSCSSHRRNSPKKLSITSKELPKIHSPKTIKTMDHRFQRNEHSGDSRLGSSSKELPESIYNLPTNVNDSNSIKNFHASQCELHFSKSIKHSSNNINDKDVCDKNSNCIERLWQFCRQNPSRQNSARRTRVIRVRRYTT